MPSVFSTLPSWVILVRLMMILPTGSLRHLFSSHLVLPGSLLTTCSDLLSITSLPPKTDEDPPQSFMQNFVLKPAGDSFFIQHDVFRLVLHIVAAKNSRLPFQPHPHIKLNR